MTASEAAQDTVEFPESIQQIIQALEQDQALSPSQMASVLRKAQVQLSDIQPWADFEHPVEDSYGRQMVYKGGNYELMVMSWCPGDFSTIHDHGYTQWGAVQIFGPAEHATFRWEEGRLSTLARWRVEPGDVIGVGHRLIHQMGNPTEQDYFLSLHIYGSPSDREMVTGDARIFDLIEGQVKRIDGGVFYGLDEQEVKAREGVLQGDFQTRFRDGLETLRRLIKRSPQADLTAEIAQAYDSSQLLQLNESLSQIIDERGHSTNRIQWRILNGELRQGAMLQQQLGGEADTQDHFEDYAEMYDELIGRPCLEQFMAPYLRACIARCGIEPAQTRLVSLGVGTGLVEEHMVQELGFQPEQILGIDISESMVKVAQKRIDARVGDLLGEMPVWGSYDLAYSGLNVFHYLDCERLHEAIERTASLLSPGGWFMGDFITPDHMRWYPHVMRSAEGDIISLRSPQAIAEGGRIFMESEIVNLDFRGEQMRINYAGKHRRFLPPIHRIRQYFEQAFGGEVQLYDAHSMEPIAAHEDTCPSTRYVVLAQKS